MKIIWNTLIYMTVRGVGYGAKFGGILGLVLGTLSGSPVPMLIGAFYGIIFGGIMGLITGIASGLVIGIVIWRFPDPLSHHVLYRRLIGISGAIATFVSAEVGFLVVLDGHSYHPDNFALFLIFLIPSLIATAVATRAGLGFAQRHIEKNERKRSEKPSHVQSYLTV